MIVRRKDMRTQVRTLMKGGKGDVTVLHLVETDEMPNVRFIGEMTLPRGASIGDHVHDEETEYYIITDGIGVVCEGGEDHRVGRGDVIVTGGGASHNIRNIGSTPLKVLGFIVTH